MLDAYSRRDPILILDDGTQLTRAALEELMAPFRKAFDSSAKLLVLCFAARNVPTIVCSFSAMAAGHALSLVDPAGRGTDSAYSLQPDIVVDSTGDARIPAPSPGAYREVRAPDRSPVRVYRRRHPAERRLFDDLALLLATSGSTGRMRFVRLSRKNLDANASAISEGLGLDSSTRAITSLPLGYSYGLSILNSSRWAGAPVVVSDAHPASSRFWEIVRAQRVTAVSGVPLTYELLLRSSFDPGSFGGVTHYTQAGGKLSANSLRAFASRLRPGQAIVPMYGQTEATARMTILRWEDFWSHSDSVGKPISGGTMWIEKPDGSVLPDGAVGQLVYAGPNVMLGYADGPDSLGGGDDLNGTLHTGDLGFMREGFVHVTGRTSRFAKIGGYRISLDRIEEQLAGYGRCAAVNLDDEAVAIVFESMGPLFARDEAAALRLVAKRIALPPPAFRVIFLDELPRLPSGKIDLLRLADAVGASEARDAPNRITKLVV